MTTQVASRIETINCNILSINQGIIVHQVNCKGAMGAGLAKAIKNQYRKAFERYKHYCDSGEFKLGMVQLVRVNETLTIANLAGQDEFGSTKVHTDLNAINTALPKLAERAKNLGLVCYFPHYMGCRNGAAPLKAKEKEQLWQSIVELIEYHFEPGMAVICKADASDNKVSS